MSSAPGAGEARRDLGLRRRLASRLRPAVLLIGVVISLGFPSTFFLIERAALHDAATRHALELARQVQSLELQAPGLWKYQSEKYLQILDAFVADKPIDAVEVEDERGQPVAALAFLSPRAAQPWRRLSPAGSAPMTFNNRRLGSVTVHVSAASLAWHTAIALLVAGAVGVGLAVFVYAFPVCIVARMEARLRELNATHERLYEEAQERLVRVRQLADLSHLVSSSLDLERVLESVTESARELVQADLVRLWVADEDARLLRLAATAHRVAEDGGSDGVTAIPLCTGLIGAVLERGITHYTADMLEEPLFVNKDWARALGYVSHLAVPLICGGRSRGLLAIFARARREFTAEERSLLEVFAGKAATAVENSRLYAALRKRLVRLRTLAHLNRLVSSSLDRGEVLREINRAAAQLLDAPVASFWVADAARESLDAVAFSDPEIGADFPVQRLRFGEGAVGCVAVRREIANIPDVFADARMVALDWWRLHGLSSCFAVPVVIDDRVVGVLALNGRRPFRLDADDEDLLASFVSQIGVAIRNADLYEESCQQGRRLASLVESTQRLTRASTWPPSSDPSRRLRRCSSRGMRASDCSRASS